MVLGTRSVKYWVLGPSGCTVFTAHPSGYMFVWRDVGRAPQDHVNIRVPQKRFSASPHLGPETRSCDPYVHITLDYSLRYHNIPYSNIPWCRKQNRKYQTVGSLCSSGLPAPQWDLCRGSGPSWLSSSG